MFIENERPFSQIEKHYWKHQVYLTKDSMVLYEVQYTFSLGSQVWYFSGNSWIQKLNKTHTNQDNIASIQYFCLTCASIVAVSTLSYNLSSLHFTSSQFLQLPFYPRSSGKDTDAVEAIAVVCLLHWVVQRHCCCRQYSILYARVGPFPFQAFIRKRCRHRNCLDMTISVILGVGYNFKFFIPTLLSLLPHLSHIYDVVLVYSCDSLCTSSCYYVFHPPLPSYLNFSRFKTGKLRCTVTDSWNHPILSSLWPPIIISASKITTLEQQNLFASLCPTSYSSK